MSGSRPIREPLVKLALGYCYDCMNAFSSIEVRVHKSGIVLIAASTHLSLDDEYYVLVVALDCLYRAL